jgi:hypothetical protein
MQFTMRFDMENDAFVANPEWEAAQMLEDAALKLRNFGESSGVVIDGNGNTIGGWEITD